VAYALSAPDGAASSGRRVKDKKGEVLDKRRCARAANGCHSLAMKTKLEKAPHKLGDNPKEPAVKARKHDPNFKQSRDVREDRGERQIKTGRVPRSPRG
jgi:hypothetical protein